MQRPLASSILLILSFVAFVSSSTLVITQFPHYQTFDSWDTCSFIGNCYEQACPSLKGGWTNPDFHSSPPFPLDVRNWWVNTGPTTSNVNFTTGTPLPCDQVLTGPCGDHTSGSGKYLYAEASGCFGFYFKALSPLFVYTNANASVSLYYYMFGSNLNTTNRFGYLDLLVSVNNGSWISLVNVTGRQQTAGDQPWIQFSQILDPLFPAVATASVPVIAQFMLWARAPGVRGSGTFWKGDIAVDDFLATQAGASNVLVPYIDPNTNSTSSTGEGGDGGITDGDIAGIVVGVLGGLGLLCCCLLLLVLLLLLLISPRGPGKKGAAPQAAGDDDL